MFIILPVPIWFVFIILLLAYKGWKSVSAPKENNNIVDKFFLIVGIGGVLILLILAMIIYAAL